MTEKIVVRRCPKCRKERRVKDRGRPTVGVCRACSLTGRANLWARKHGGHKTPLYKVWSAMKQRCDNPKNKYFPDYGGRGITYTDEWLDFSLFESWAKSSGYRQGLYLDRRENNYHYTPSNCRWVSPAGSTRNRRCVKLTAQDAEDIRRLRELGVPYSTLTKKYNVRQGTLTYIMSGRNWRPDSSDGRPVVKES